MHNMVFESTFGSIIKKCCIWVKNAKVKEIHGVLKNNVEQNIKQLTMLFFFSGYEGKT